MKKKLMILIILLLGSFSLYKGSQVVFNQIFQQNNIEEQIPDFDGSHYSIEINSNHPFFEEKDLKLKDGLFLLSPLDSFNRAGSAMTICSKDTVSEDSREDISHLIPTGFVNKEYEVIENDTLYNRCHLLMFMACGGKRTDVIENMITGTSYFNKSKSDGMLKYETMLLNYIKNTDHHVLYRVTPFYHGKDLVAYGVLMEAKAIDSDDFEFCVFVYNEQPGIEINHRDGSSKQITNRVTIIEVKEERHDEQLHDYILNKNSKSFHYPWCDSVGSMKEKNKKYKNQVTREQVISEGYHPCGNCNP